MCKTTKQTLFHYDRENLLRPKYTAENGYRYYGKEQLFDFDLIATFKETGSSLREIRHYMHATNPRSFLELLEAKRLAVKEEKRRLARREMMLEDLAACTREALEVPYDTFMVIWQEEERLEVLPSNAPEDETNGEFAERYAEFTYFFETQGRRPRYPIGAIGDRAAFINGNFHERYLFCSATRQTPKSRMLVKEAGEYAIIAHSGPEHSHYQMQKEFAAQVRSRGLAAASDLYFYDMVSYVLHGGGDTFSAKYCVRVV